MAITSAQQIRQMLEDGGMLVKPRSDGKRPGYYGPDAGHENDPGTSGNTGGGNADARDRQMGLQGKTGRKDKSLDTGGGFDKVDRSKVSQFSTYGKNVMAKNLKSLQPSFKDRAGKFISNLPSMRAITFATNILGNIFGGPKTGYSTQGAPYGNVPGALRSDSGLVGDDDDDDNVGGGDGYVGDPCRGPNPPAYCFVGIRSQASNTTDPVVDTDPEIPYRLMAEGGIMNSMDEDIRQQLFLGGVAKGIKKAVKGATRAVKKIAKSKVGKAALLAGLSFGIPGTGIGGLFGRASFGGPAKGLFGSYGMGPTMAKLFANPTTSQMKIDGMTKGFFPKLFEGMSTGKKAALGIGALTALPLLGIGTGDDEEEGEAYRGEGLDIASIRRNPYLAMQRSGSPYRLMAEGGDTEDAEPVAKKTMPLLDMGGKEKDYRETGGFVDIGRMEKADDVPARLSKNEFVFTADAVRNAGEGDIDKGAEVMYNMMKNLESGGEVSEESQGLEGAKEMFQTSQRLEGVM